MSDNLTCRTCGKTGEQTGAFVQPGATGTLTTGLDPENCVGCWDLMATNGMAPGIITADKQWVPIPRSLPEGKTTTAS